jgi:hypothetical protein
MRTAMIFISFMWGVFLGLGCEVSGPGLHPYCVVLGFLVWSWLAALVGHWDVHKIIGAIWPILRVSFGVLFGVLMEYSTQ